MLPTLEAPTPRLASGFRLGVPLLVLVIGCVLAAVGGRFVYDQGEKTDALRFRRIGERVSDTMISRLASIEEALYGARGLFAASENVERAEWTNYARSVEIYLRRGVLRFGYIARVRRADLPAFLARVRADGAPEFQVRPAGERDELYLITYAEPHDYEAIRLGVDITADEPRREAADAAMQTGRPALTRRVDLALDQGQIPGVVLLLPVYGENRRLETPDDRRQALEGWVYAAIRIDELMQGITRQAENQVDFDVFEGESATRSSLLYDSDRHMSSQHGEAVTAADYADRRFSALVPLSIYGRHWSLWISSRPEFGATISRLMMTVVLGGGAVISLLAALLAWLLLTARTRAVALAERMIRDLRATEADLRHERILMDTFMHSVADV
ncbi:MAG: CHASE domain-containing protein, partial [Opitutaceae bacterium]